MRNLVIGSIVGAVVMFVAFYPITTSNKESLNDLENRLDGIQERIVEKTVFTIVEDPSLLFRFVEDAPAWEEIDAVPYSRCYRHLIGTTTADFILCKAI